MALFNKLYLRTYYFKTFKRSLSSALFIPGNKASETYSVVTPFIDSDCFKDIEKLEINVAARCIDINIKELKQMWDFYKSIENNKIKLEKNREEIVSKIKLLATSDNEKLEEINHLKNLGKLMREDLKIVKENLWSVEENVITKVLKLPNALHPKTPQKHDTKFHVFKTKPQILSPKSHVDIGLKNDLLDFYSSNLFFLKGDLPLYELGLMFYLTDIFQNFKYTQFSNTDFTRSVVIEGCGLNHRGKSVYTLQETDTAKPNPDFRLHLTGAASLTSFMAYHTRHFVFPSMLPLKYFCTGRQYRPPNESNTGLFDANQTTAFEIFIATISSDVEMNNELDQVLLNVIKIYESLGYHFRVVFKSAKDLQMWESLRVSFEMYSPFLGSYVEVGNVSVCDNFISKRLLFTYVDNNKVREYPKVLSGTVLNFSKFIACVLEQSEENISMIIPEIVKPYT